MSDYTVLKRGFHTSNDPEGLLKALCKGLGCVVERAARDAEECALSGKHLTDTEVLGWECIQEDLPDYLMDDVWMYFCHDLRLKTPVRIVVDTVCANSALVVMKKIREELEVKPDQDPAWKHWRQLGEQTVERAARENPESILFNLESVTLLLKLSCAKAAQICYQEAKNIYQRTTHWSIDLPMIWDAIDPETGEFVSKTGPESQKG